MIAVDGCDSECYVRHHLCAIREVKRLRALVDSLVCTPQDARCRYEFLLEMYDAQCRTTDRLTARAKAAEEKLRDTKEVVPAAWLEKANRTISELNEALCRLVENGK